MKADISQFETLQNKTNKTMGYTGSDVFNVEFKENRPIKPEERAKINQFGREAIVIEERYEVA